MSLKLREYNEHITLIEKGRKCAFTMDMLSSLLYLSSACFDKLTKKVKTCRT